MSNLAKITTKELFQKDEVKNKFKELLGKRATSFMTSVLQIVSSNDLLVNADPTSVYQAAAVAATLDLPLNNNLGFAYIVPYNAKQKDGSYKQVAQFQLGYKGFLQLALRSGQFLAINEAPIYEGQIKSNNPLTGIEFDFTAKKSDLVIGYAAYFKLLNGFEKTLFMSVDELKKHGKKYSQTFKKDYGLWKDDFDAMARKTVIKLLLSKGAPLSVEMQKAVITDQAVINDADTLDVDYTDNDKTEIDKEAERIRLMVGDCQTIEDLNHLQETIGADFPVSLFDERRAELNGSK
jgi:recombination protein RecT